MRKLVIARGLPGSGKSTFLNNAGLTDHTISPDAIRLVLSGAELSGSGEMSIPQFHGAKVWEVAHESLAARISRGETIAFDAVLATAKEVMSIAQPALDARYDVCVVDFSSLSLKAVLKQNNQRNETRRVPLDAIERFAASWQECPPSLRKIAVPEIGADNAHHLLREFLTDTTRLVDLSQYERIVHIGDLQGCLSPLLDPASPLANGFADDTFYVFHGDFLDRGLENSEVIRWLNDTAVDRDNICFLDGNHEDHIRLLIAGQPAKSREFEFRTLPALRAGGVTDEMLTRITSKLIPVLAYHWRGISVLSSHAGFPRWPTSLELVPDLQCRIGPGVFGTPIDEAFSAWALSDGPLQIQGGIIPTREVWQVHGHRNRDMLPVIAGPRSINLEGQVEFGGHMRFAILDASGWTPIEIRNRHFRSMQECRAIDQAEGRKPFGKAAPITPWIARGDEVEPAFNPDTLAAFRKHDMVAEHRSESLPHIASLNFTKQAFFSKSWDDVTIHARGLFIDTADGHIVARSYEKFFNWGERPETSDEALGKNLALPVTGYLKENGYLGISGYDRKTDRLILASKSRIDGDFAGWFQEIAEQVLGIAGLEKLLRFNRDQGASCVFEVVDPIRDPHIIAYHQPTIILLAAVRRSERFEQLPYNDLVKLADYLGCKVKKKLFEIPHWPAVQRKAHEAMTNLHWSHARGEGPSEGFVLEDANGFHVKVKAKFYSFWKYMRAAKDRVLAARKRGASIDLARYEGDALALDFIAFCQRQPDDVLQQDIITLRDAFLADPDQVVIIDQAPPAAPEPKVPDQTSFLKGMNAIAGQIDAGTAKVQTVRRIIERAGECHHRKAAFDAHPRAADFHNYVANPAS